MVVHLYRKRCRRWTPYTLPTSSQSPLYLRPGMWSCQCPHSRSSGLKSEWCCDSADQSEIALVCPRSAAQIRGSKNGNPWTGRRGTEGKALLEISISWPRGGRGCTVLVHLYIFFCKRWRLRTVLQTYSLSVGHQQASSGWLGRNQALSLQLSNLPGSQPLKKKGCLFIFFLFISCNTALKRVHTTSVTSTKRSTF